MPEGHHVIVCPTILLDNWVDELDKYFKEDTFGRRLVLHGETRQRLIRNGTLDVEPLRSLHLLITNYETLARHQKSLLQLDFDIVIFDEAQMVKNADALRARASRALKRTFAVAMTGTPVENKLTDLWAIYDAVQMKDPRAFGRRREFDSEFSKTGVAGIAALRSRLRFPSSTSSLLRRQKAETLRNLPSKTIVARRIEMTPAQAEMELAIVRAAKRTGALAELDSLKKLYQQPLLLQQVGAARLSIEGARSLSRCNVITSKRCNAATLSRHNLLT